MSASLEDAALRLRKEWEPRFISFVAEHPGADPGHGQSHLVHLVVRGNLGAAVEEAARRDVVAGRVRSLYA